MVYDLLPELHVVRDMFKRRFPEYPRQFCSVTSATLEGCLGFPQAVGYFRNGSLHEHRWNYDPESGMYLDFTPDQFEDGLPDILVLPRGSAEAGLFYVELFRTPDTRELARRRAEFRLMAKRS